MVIRSATPEDLVGAAALARASFSHSVAPLYSEKGVQTFMEFATVEGLTDRMNNDFATYVAIEDEKMVGMAHVRDKNHTSMLFVAPAEQRRGIGKALLNYLVGATGSKAFTVNSSPNAELVYERFGFSQTSEEQITDGIRYIPMLLEIEQWSSESLPPN